MRKVPLAAAVFASLACPAFAADLNSLKDAPVYVAPPAVFSWTGFYIGADAGGGWGENVAAIAATPISPAGTVTTQLRGVVGGGFVGYNYQINQFVIGVQGDIQGSGVSGRVYSPLFDVTERVQDDYLAAINGRLGFAYDRVLFYAIGGAAFTHASFDHFAGPTLTAVLQQFGIPTTPVKLSHEWTGYDIGGGVEYAITPNWTARVEYRYYDFGAFNFPATGFVPHGTVKQTDNTVTFGVSYLFGGPAAAPVPAKY